MSYPEHSVEAGLLRDDPEALGQVIRWIAVVVTSPRFWALRDEWQDLHQEVLLRVVESLRRESFDSSRDFRAYVQAVAQYTALRELTRRRRAANDLRPVDLASVDAVSLEDRAVFRQLVRRVLDLATEDCRRLIRSYFFEQRSYAELAASLGIPEGTVKSRLFRCLESATRAIHGGSPHRTQEKVR